MNCIFCKQPTDEQRNFGYSYDVRGTTFGKGGEKPCCKSCWDRHWKEATKFWDGVDEVMNRNKHFIRSKGMEGTYKDGDKEYSPVYAQWKRVDIEGNLAPYIVDDMKYIQGFRDWLRDNDLKYKYESR